MTKYPLLTKKKIHDYEEFGTQFLRPCHFYCCVPEGNMLGKINTEC